MFVQFIMKPVVQQYR
jgi:ribosome assembly protein 1